MRSRAPTMPPNRSARARRLVTVGAGLALLGSAALAIAAHRSSSGADAAPRPAAVAAVVGSPSPVPAPTQSPSFGIAAPVPGLGPDHGALSARGANPAHRAVRLIVSRIGVDATVESVGNDASGAMGVPAAWDDVAWYNRAAVPGEPGEAVIDGHLDSTTGRAVFWRLGELRVGDHVTVVFDDGASHVFRIATTGKVAAGSTIMLGTGGPPRLMLITCSGTWLRGQHQYSQRLVLESDLVS